MKTQARTETEPRAGSTGAAVAAGWLGAVLAVMALAALGIWLMRRMGPRMTRGMMRRMMSEGEMGERMRECMERCGCAEPEDAPDGS